MTCPVLHIWLNGWTNKPNQTKPNQMKVQISDEELNQMIFSTWEKLTDGVPQGLVLGRLLFLIYVYIYIYIYIYIYKWSA